MVGVCMAGGVHGREGCTWQGMCVAGWGMSCRGHVWQGGVHGRGCAWQGCMCGGGHAWQKAGGMHSFFENVWYSIRSDIASIKANLLVAERFGE